MMKILKYSAMIGLAIAFAGIVPGTAGAQVRVGVAIGVGSPLYVGPPPVCTYGYYPYAPHACAPYGYYGSEWFEGGVFIGAGPWFHGFYGPAFYGYPVFHDRAWIYFHDHDGWRYYHDGDRWRDYRGEGWRGHGGWSDFRGHDAYRGSGHRDFRASAPHSYPGNRGFRGGDRRTHGNGNRGFHGGNHGGHGNGHHGRGGRR